MTAPQVRSTTTGYHIHPETHVGHVHLRVANLERAIAFYRDLLGFTITNDMRTELKPRQVAFLSASHAAGHYHHHVALAEFPGVTAPTTQQAGLFHIAFLYPSRWELARALRRILDHGIRSTVAMTTASVRQSICATRTASRWSCTMIAATTHCTCITKGSMPPPFSRDSTTTRQLMPSW